MISDVDTRTPVDRILEEQQSLTAVERFARYHETGSPPAQQRYYKDLIPLTAPGPGQQYAFEVDLDRCSGCQACVTACHALNGLDDDESWRKIGLLYSDSPSAPYQATVTTACHHCVDPGCLTGCPVLAYEKDPVTGIVHHLDDQCIGCQYCVMKCPYEVPHYSAARGIVRKCDMCSSRLDHGEAPACVQACPTQAIRITLVDQSAVLLGYRGGSAQFLPDSPDPRHTAPTTTFKASRPLPESLLAGDHARTERAHSHPALVFMLVLTQLAVGASIGAVCGGPARAFALISAAAGALAVGVGTLHLGKPLKAWRAFLGWRTSWFSREVMAFGAFLPAAALAAASFWLPRLAHARTSLSFATAAMGLLGVGCSAMIYVDTRRAFWNPVQCFGRFLGTTFLLGAVLAMTLCAGVRPIPARLLEELALLAAALSAGKLAIEFQVLRHRADGGTPARGQLARTAHLLSHQLCLEKRSRAFCAVAGGLFLPAVVALQCAAGIGGVFWTSAAALALCTCGELVERYLFFTAVSPDRMPGGRAA